MGDIDIMLKNVNRWLPGYIKDRLQKSFLGVTLSSRGAKRRGIYRGVILSHPERSQPKADEVEGSIASHNIKDSSTRRLRRLGRNDKSPLASLGMTKVRAGAHRPQHIFLAICDHYEPLWNKVDYDTGLGRIKTWCDKYPKIADKYKDFDGKLPRHTFFYPIEEYHPEYMGLLADLCRRGYGEVEVHLHHDNDTE